MPVREPLLPGFVIRVVAFIGEYKKLVRLYSWFARICLISFTLDSRELLVLIYLILADTIEDYLVRLRFAYFAPISLSLNRKSAGRLTECLDKVIVFFLSV